MISKPSVLNRISVAFVNFLLLILLTFIFDALCTSRIATSLDGYKEIQNTYFSLEKEYSALQDKYQLYTYDENNNRIKNEQITDEQKTAFLSDERVITIKKETSILSNKIRLYTLIPLVISYIVMSVFVYLLPPLIFKKRQNIGMKSFGVVLMKHEEIVNRRQVFLYLGLYVIFHCILGLITLFIINIVDIVFLNYNKDKRTLLERVFNYDLAVDPDKIYAEYIEEEKNS